MQAFVGDFREFGLYDVSEIAVLSYHIFIQ